MLFSATSYDCRAIKSEKKTLSAHFKRHWIVQQPSVPRKRVKTEPRQRNREPTSNLLMVRWVVVFHACVQLIKVVCRAVTIQRTQLSEDTEFYQLSVTFSPCLNPASNLSATLSLLLFTRR